MSEWLSLVRPGDLVVVAQGVGEPTPLLEELLAAAPPDVEVFVGLSYSDALTRATRARLLSFGAMGPLRARRSHLDVVPAHFDDLPRVLPHRGRDLVLLMQVTAAGPDGRHGLGMAVDHTHPLLASARAVVAEVNAQLPDSSAPRLAPSTFDATVPSSRPLPDVPAPTIGEAHRRIAGFVAAAIPDGATLQLGIGAVPAAVGRCLVDHRDLAVRSTLVGDWLLDLASAGALRPGPDAVTISEAAGSAELYKYVATSSVSVRPVSEVTGGVTTGAVERFVAVNSALQVDLTGQVNAEETPAGFVGGIGGQAEYLRAASRSPGGCAIVALPAEVGRHSRIVRRLDPPTVTTARSYVDLVVTEHGVADLRGRTLRERRESMIALAAPEHRAALQEEDR